MNEMSRLAGTDRETSDPTGTVIRFYRAIDCREYEVLASLFTPDGVWIRQGAELRGEAAILAAMAQRPPTLRVAHLLTNLLAEPCDDGETEVWAYMLVVRHDADPGQPGPSPLSGIESIRATRARLRRTEQGWRIVRVASDPPTFVA